LLSVRGEDVRYYLFAEVVAFDRKLERDSSPGNGSSACTYTPAQEVRHSTLSTAAAAATITAPSRTVVIGGSIWLFMILRAAQAIAGAGTHTEALPKRREAAIHTLVATAGGGGAFENSNDRRSGDSSSINSAIIIIINITIV
jgi:hypothetical protein